MAENPNIKPVGQGDWVRMGIYAFPGWGKTSLVGTSAEVGRTLIIRSSADLIPARVLKLKGLDEIICNTWEQQFEALDYCRMAQDFPYQWVWWDCVSVAQDVLLDDVWAATVAEKPHRGVLTPAGGLDKGEYGRNMERIQQWVRHMVGCNRFHFGMTFYPHEGKHPTNDEGGDLLRPYVQGKNMTEKLSGYCNLLGFLEVMENDDQKWRRLHVAENARFYAKDQYDAFLPKGYLDHPSVAKIMAAIEKARGKPLGNNVRSIRGRGRASATTTTRAAGRRRAT